MGKINSRAKGCVGERELAGELNRLFDVQARRGQQFSGLGGQDVVGLHDRIHVECKRVEKLNIQTAMTQAVRDGVDKLPIVFHRRNHGDWMATILLDDLPRVAAILASLKPADGSGGVV